VFPDDVIVVDGDGAVVIPQKLVAEVSGIAAEQERLEDWIMSRVNDGAALPGLYPPNAENRALYEAAAKAQ
jgi:regulator of RNase E activity RraA